jgi:serralysin
MYHLAGTGVNHGQGPIGKTGGMTMQTARQFSCVMLAALLLPMSALATRDQWDISEVYSNADGSVQYIEMLNLSNNQNQLSLGKLIADSDGIIMKFDFLTNTPDTSTANKRVTIATPGFANLPGAIVPDYTFLVGPFFDPTANSVTISFTTSTESTTFHSVTFTSTDLPTNGVDSLNNDLSTGTNSPTNYAGETGQLPLFVNGFE